MIKTKTHNIKEIKISQKLQYTWPEVLNTMLPDEDTVQHLLRLTWENLLIILCYSFFP
jgi:hypothetical protein